MVSNVEAEPVFCGVVAFQVLALVDIHCGHSSPTPNQDPRQFASATVLAFVNSIQATRY